MPPDSPRQPNLADRGTSVGQTNPPQSDLAGNITRENVSAGTGGDAAQTPTTEFEFLAPPQAPDEIGRLGIYRVLQVVGLGGMGVVFKAEDPQLRRFVALKVMKFGLGESTMRQRFLGEAQKAASIRHDNVVTIYQVGEDRGVPYFAMEFLEGESLDVRLLRVRKVPLPEVLRIGREIAEGLAAAHGRGIIHRDIKPANLWIESRRGRVKILDFGLARTAAGDTSPSMVNSIMGTPAFMAPEQAQGTLLDHRCDLFSLGCVLYYMSTGKLPFRGKNHVETLVALATALPKPLREHDPSLPETFEDLVLQLIEKDPTRRPGSVEQIADELESIGRDLASQDVQASDDPATLKDSVPRTSRGRASTSKPEQSKSNPPPESTDGAASRDGKKSGQSDRHCRNREEPPMLLQLIPVQGGDPIGIRRDLTVVGRDENECDLIIDRKSVSKLHCVIVKAGTYLYVRDLASANGTSLNGQRIVRGPLLPGDELAFANLKFHVQVGPDTTSRKSRPAKTEEIEPEFDDDEIELESLDD